ncbi:MAG TPA: DUF4411 family protein [Vicinamibacterales bacterium]|nr:DUF4411 family protein [Vicinamibacterales bacterium]
MDTSAWLDIDVSPDPPRLWALVEALIAADRLFSLGRIVGEDGEVKSIADKVKPYRDRLTRCDRNDAAFLLEAGKVALAFPRMAKPRGRKTVADSFVVALALLDGYTVVASESLKKRANGKIPGACRLLGVACIPLAELVERETKLMSALRSA